MRYEMRGMRKNKIDPLLARLDGQRWVLKVEILHFGPK
jgi:hypothetical protein